MIKNKFLAEENTTLKTKSLTAQEFRIIQKTKRNDQYQIRIAEEDALQRKAAYHKMRRLEKELWLEQYATGKT